jgi:hypothetical protein
MPTKTCETCKHFQPSANKAKTRGACLQTEKKVVEKVHSCDEFVSTKPKCDMNEEFASKRKPK